MTHFLRDILRQPGQLQKTLDALWGADRGTLFEATTAIRSAHHVYLTGIGSSWNAALCVGPLFHHAGHPVHLQDAGELQFAAFPRGTVIIAISRTGRSVEIVHLLAKARDSNALVIGITNSADGPLAREAQIPLVVPVDFDHAISVNTYSTLAAAAGLLASASVNCLDDILVASLSRSFAETSDRITDWQQQVEDTPWLAPRAVYYFLARGSSLGSCHEARLLWEEGAKSPATAMGTSSFRHGPQEMIIKDIRVGMWIDGQRMREQDLAVAADLRRLGASVTLFGQNLSEDAADLVFRLPEVRPEWQFLVDMIPAQLAAERLSRLAGVDCDSFRLCSYIVDDEWGLVREDAVVPKVEIWPGSR